MIGSTCNLLIDSCCDLPFDVVNRENVGLISFPYYFGTQETLDDLWQTSTSKEFYERMSKGEQPTTAGAPFQLMKDMFEKCIESGRPTVYLSFSSGLSGHFDRVLRVRDMVLEEHPEAELYVVDTHLASTGEALLIFEALRQHERGMSAKELADWATEAQYFVHVYFMVDDLESLRRGGRIPSSVAFAGSKLDVKPLLFIAIDGTLQIKGIARGRKKGLKQLAEFFAQKAELTEDDPYVIIGSAEAPKDVKKLEELVLKESKKEEPIFVEHTVGPVIGSHVGPGMVAISFWGPDKREEMSVANRIARKVKGTE